MPKTIPEFAKGNPEIAAMLTALEKFRSGEIRPTVVDGHTVIATTSASGDVVILNECKGLTPSDWKYWALSCWALPA